MCGELSNTVPYSTSSSGRQVGEGKIGKGRRPSRWGRGPARSRIVYCHGSFVMRPPLTPYQARPPTSRIEGNIGGYKPTPSNE